MSQFSRMNSYVELTMKDQNKLRKDKDKKILHQQILLAEEMNQSLQNIKKYLDTNNISIEDMENAVTYSIQSIFNINCAELRDNIKRLFVSAASMMQKLQKQQSNLLDPSLNSSDQKENQSKIDISNISISQIKEVSSHEEPQNMKILQDLQRMGLNEDKASSFIFKKESIFGSTQASNKKQVQIPDNPFKQNNISSNDIQSFSNSQDFKNFFDSKSSNLFKFSSQKQKESFPSKKLFQQSSENYQQLFARREWPIQQIKKGKDLCLPLSWQKNSSFDIKGKNISKLYGDKYKKLNASSPLRQGIHTIKFEKLKKGTVAFGVVAEQNKYNPSVDDSKYPAVKYLSFSNGGGMIKKDGQQLDSSKNLFLSNGSVIQIVYDSYKNQISFKNPLMNRPFVVPLHESFRQKKIYFFIEMKDFQTEIKQLSS